VTSWCSRAVTISHKAWFILEADGFHGGLKISLNAGLITCVKVVSDQVAGAHEEGACAVMALILAMLATKVLYYMMVMITMLLHNVMVVRLWYRKCPWNLYFLIFFLSFLRMPPFLTLFFLLQVISLEGKLKAFKTFELVVFLCLGDNNWSVVISCLLLDSLIIFFCISLCFFCRLLFFLIFLFSC
jgi:hypothetical protein